MKLATLNDGSPDGRLVVLSADGSRCGDAGSVAPTLQAALERWTGAEPALRELQRALDDGRAAGARPFVASEALAPLPRA